ncbi:MAG: GNAT family N-acetyltransferase [Anaerolineales bacterium]|jgi:ribosomal protein S18 acetylase RimI-like enzyme
MSPSNRPLEGILQQDPIWSAYALADLEPEHQPFCTWLTAGKSLVLIYQGLNPAALFLQGEGEELADLLARIPPGSYQFSCLPHHLDLIRQFFEVEKILKLWRMRFSGSTNFGGEEQSRTVRLEEDHLEHIRRLFKDQPDAPDAFLPAQLKSGVFYGAFDQEQLVAVSGTHVRSPRFKIAAIGNVFTDPDHRGQGFASLTTKAVVHDLIAAGTETIVLNVVHSNKAAIRTYRRIGFQRHCTYLEGYAERIKR